MGPSVVFEVETREVVEAERKADETFEVFGMEIRKAEPDSKGNERLRTKR